MSSAPSRAVPAALGTFNRHYEVSLRVADASRNFFLGVPEGPKIRCCNFRVQCFFFYHTHRWVTYIFFFNIKGISQSGFPQSTLCEAKQLLPVFEHACHHQERLPYFQSFRGKPGWPINIASSKFCLHKRNFATTGAATCVIVIDALCDCCKASLDVFSCL
jgi:hypothetical protein